MTTQDVEPIEGGGFVPRWARISAHAVPLVVLPSGLWRVALVLGLVDRNSGHHWLSWERPYVLSLTVFSECLALLTLGLVRPWGEVVPRWVPVLGGRRIPTAAAVIPAMAGATVVTGLCAYAGLNYVFHFVQPLNDTGETFPTSGPEMWALMICYVPLVAWGPLLAAVTIAYHRRRRSTRSREVPVCTGHAMSR
ncbi:hypothetical protein [Streptomyces sp. NBC_01233]|uniref:hypothetical protein n=1 Tax=Streptomyces sp. NBC_01233 TaxID=2903787 RepID=UPI002E16559E|nr:hypothetical protein OG332_04060 [Streptomyces sp. NBC_01233]